MALPRKSQDNSVGRSEYEAECKVELLGSFPEIGEFMTRSLWEDGTERKTGTLTVSCQDGAWKGCLTDRETLKKCWGTFDSLQQLLESFEAGLAAEDLPWRNDAWARERASEKERGGRKGR